MSGMNQFFAYAKERQRVFLRRFVLGQRGPWTGDRILQQYRFCNIFREDDKTTAWIRENVREPLRDDPKVLAAMIIARWFNRIETLEILLQAGLFKNWSSAKARRLLSSAHPLVTGAYMIKTPAKMNKLEGLIWCLEQILPDTDHLAFHIEPGKTTLQGVTEVLSGYPYLGPFMAYEVATDLRHTALLEKAPDIMTWANPGPGAVRGAGRVANGDPDYYNYGSKFDMSAVQSTMRKLLAESGKDSCWPSSWKRWEMREVEHTLCEFDKYERTRLGQGRPKQLFRGAS